MHKLISCSICVLLVVTFTLVPEPLKIAFAMPAGVSLVYIVLGAIEEGILEKGES